MRAQRLVLIAVGVFQGATAVAGGIGLLAEWITPGLELLDGSPFDSYVVPGLALLGVGAGTLVAVAAVVRRSPLGLPLAALAGLAMIVFEVVEVAVIGYHFLQIFYGLVGATLILSAFRLSLAGGAGARGWIGRLA